MVPRDRFVLLLFVASLLMVLLLVLSVVSLFGSGIWRFSEVRDSLANLSFTASDQLGAQVAPEVSPVSEEVTDGFVASGEVVLLEETPEVEIYPDSLGLVEYPVVHIDDTFSVFAEEAVEATRRFSEEEIVARCAYVTIPFNHARCLKAERACAAVLTSAREHLDCLGENGHWAIINGDI